MAILTPASVFRRYKTDGVPESGKHDPEKAEIVQLLEQVQGTASAPAVVKQTRAALDALTPASETYGGLVLNDPDPANNGYYSRADGVWVWGRGFPDTFAVLSDIGGTANAIVANTQAGVSPADILVVILPSPVGTNTDASVTLSIDGNPAVPVRTAAGSALSAGDIVAGVGTMFFRAGGEWRQLFSSATGASFDHQGSWSGLTTYTEAQVVTGSNGNWYQLKVPSSLNDNPVSGGSGSWLMVMSTAAIPDGSIGFAKLAASLVQTDAEGGDEGADNEIPTAKRVASIVRAASGSKVIKSTNLLTHATFLRGLDGWATPRSTAGASVNPTFSETGGDYLSLYYGRTQVQLYADTTGKSLRMVSARQHAVKSSMKYKVGATLVSDSGTLPSTFRVMCYSAAGAHLGTLTINASVPASVASANSNVFGGVVNEAGGSAPAWPAGTVSAAVDVGFSSTAAQGLYVSSFWCIGDDEYPGSIATAPTYAAAGGTHEAISVGDYIYLINHSLSQLVKFDKHLKKVATLSINAYPHDILAIGGDLWVVSQNAFTVQRINIASFTVTNTYPIPGSRWGFGLATDGSRLWCGAGNLAQTPTLFEVNTTTGAFTSLSTDVNEGNDTNIPVRFAAGSVWSAHLTNGQVKRINPTGGATLATISCGLGPIYGLGVGEGWVFANCREGIAQIDPATNTVAAIYRYRETSNGQSNVEVSGGRAYGCSANGLIICDLASRTSFEIVLDAGGNKWARVMPDQKTVLVGVYAGPWMFMVR